MKTPLMKIHLILMVAIFAFAAPAAFAQVSTKATPGKAAAKLRHRIVYDVAAADTAQQAGLMRQLSNVKRHWPDARIEVVVHGKGLPLLLKDKAYKAGALKALQDKGVVFAACQNTMRFLKVTEAELLPGVITVPSAISELVTKQEEGWSYIRFQ